LCLWCDGLRLACLTQRGAVGLFGAGELAHWLLKRLDRGLTDQDFADAARRLDKVDDGWFASLGLGRRDIAAPRERFAAWRRNSNPFNRPWSSVRRR
jgi:hypothetical protein